MGKILFLAIFWYSTTLNHIFQQNSEFLPKIVCIRKMAKKQPLRDVKNSNFWHFNLGYCENLQEKIKE